MASFRKYLTETTAEQTFSNQGSSSIKQKQSNARWGDNALEDETEKLEEFDQTPSLDRLQNMLNDAGVSDDEIKAGVKLTQNGLQKAAAALAISPDEVPILIASLMTRLRRVDDHLEERYEAFIRDQNRYNRINEQDRFSTERDYLNNVTVRDNHSGKEVFLQGSDADKLISRLRKNPSKEQEILAGYGHLMESTYDNFDDEIESDGGGSYNFPWEYQGEHGLATVLFSEKKGKPDFDLNSVRDEDGEEITVDNDMRDDLTRQAKDFIGKE